jgi:hypothetical protein
MHQWGKNEPDLSITDMEIMEVLWNWELKSKQYETNYSIFYTKLPHILSGMIQDTAKKIWPGWLALAKIYTHTQGY